MATTLDLHDPEYQQALAEVLKFEGGYCNDPADPGGATNFGITQREYDSWRRRKGFPFRSVKFIEPGERSEIYREDFWLPMHCDILHYPVALMLFDTAVQWGVHGALTILASIHATDSTSIATACGQILAARSAFRVQRVKKNPSQLRFLLGWQNRDKKLYALAMKALAAAAPVSNSAPAK